MSGSSSSHNQIVVENDDDTNERTSWTIDHSARRFWNCLYSLMTRVRNCRYFRWKDNELLDPYYKGKLFSMKKELDRKESASEVLKCRKRIRELEKLAEKDKCEFEKELLKVRTENASLVRVLEINKIVLMILVVALGVCVGKICYG